MPQASTLTGVFRRPFDQQVSFFRNKLGNLVPTARWDDLSKGQHDVGFMVAGATKTDLLADLGSAVDRAISEGKSLDAFRKDFRDIVERRGWHGWTGEGTAKGEAWRTRIIYQTNASTSYSAGRYQQLNEGGFAFWVYKHNDSVLNPRPQHLAWHGLTLPKDHPFWQTHAPPNGWGCQCYVVGARTDRGARRLGGNPDKQPPDNWNTPDPKTGAPPGIGKGWDYQPGQHARALRMTDQLGQYDQRVQDTAIAMADKVSAWDYNLGKAYMQSLPPDGRDALALSYRSLPSVADDTRRYAARIIEGRTNLDIPSNRTLGLLTTQDADRLNAQLGRNLSGYDYAINPAAIRAQQVAATDYARLPDLLNAPDAVRVDQGNVVVEKVIDDQRWVTTWQVDDTQQSLTLQELTR